LTLLALPQPRAPREDAERPEAVRVLVPEDDVVGLLRRRAEVGAAHRIVATLSPTRARVRTRCITVLRRELRAIVGARSQVGRFLHLRSRLALAPLVAAEIAVEVTDLAATAVPPSIRLVLAEREHANPAHVAVGLAGALRVRAILVHEHELAHLVERR